jgi:hypothetical protein
MIAICAKKDIQVIFPSFSIPRQNESRSFFIKDSMNDIQSILLEPLILHQVVFRRLSGWKALRRAFGICCDHKWMPSEYQTVDEIHADALGIGQQDVDLDEVCNVGPRV